MVEIGEFEIILRPQKIWGLLSTRGGLVLLAFYIGGIGCSAYIISSLLQYMPGLILGFILTIIIKNVLHFADATHPNKALRAFLHPHFSWISRGTVFIPIFGVASAIDISQFILPHLVPPSLYLAARIVACIAAFIIIIYPSALLSSFRAFPYWKSSSFPLHFALLQFLGGVGLVSLSTILDSALGARFIEISLTVLLLTVMTTVSHNYVTSISDVVAKKSVELLFKMDLSWIYIIGALLIGLVIPLVLLVFTFLPDFAAIAGFTLPLAGFLLLIGSFLHIYSMVRAGVRATVI